MAKFTTLNYADYDFDKLVAQLQEYLSKDETWKDAYASSTGQMLIELYSYIANHVLYYIERRAEEMYISTARNRSSILNLVQLINYSPKRVVSASGEVTFYLDTAYATNIYIPRFTQLRGGALTFVTLENAEIRTGALEVTGIKAIEGSITTQTAISTGLASQEMLLNYTNVENSSDPSNPSLFVYVSGSSNWSAVSSFYSSTRTSRHYRIIHNINDTLTIQFGDGIKGYIPPVGETITVQFVLSSGLAGNFYGTGATNGIVQIVNPIVNSAGATVPVKVKNDLAFEGGMDIEATEDIRREAPKVFKTGQRAVTKEDFITIIENYSGVLAANAWGEYDVEASGGTEAEIYAMRNVVRFSAIISQSSNTWGLPGTTYLSNLIDYLKTMSVITVRYEYVDAQIIDIIPVIYITVQRGVTLTAIESAIGTIMEEAFVPGSTTSLGGMIKYSDIIRSIDEIDGVNYLNLILKMYKSMSWSEADNEYVDTLPVLPIKLRSIEVYVDDVKVATDDGLGGFTAGTTDVAVLPTWSSINYDTGAIRLGFDMGTSVPESVYVLYEQDGQGNIKMGFNQICRYTPSISWVDIRSIAYEDVQ